MEKEFIPYEQALALKELGFDEPCMRYYHTDKSLRTLSEGWLNEKCVAPLYQQAFRWFREKYVLFTQDFIDLDNKFTKNIIKVLENGQDFIYLEYYKSYEEAELECLKKLIEIVKQSQKIYDESPHSKTFRTPASDYNSRGGYRK